MLVCPTIRDDLVYPLSNRKRNIQNASSSHWTINGEMMGTEETNEFDCEFDNENENENEDSSLLTLLLRSLENVLQQVAMAEIAMMISAFQVIETSKNERL